MVNLSICDNNVVKMKRTLIILPYFMYALRLMRCLSQQQPTSIACLLLTGVVRHTKYKISKRKILFRMALYLFQLTISQIRNTAHSNIDSCFSSYMRNTDVLQLYSKSKFGAAQNFDTVVVF
ncbi:hypothetical protein T4D_2801 [Trichinella pseudospiralis]|uniref:Uncharacterized protein n=1 Tax=Trichinella pseudospiralis TaxID=6337 RepID=A0A0V1F6L3_TRIPS|nr:hypothetical protein T4D_2801 [Trichinella pseudospiralis]